MARIQCFNNLLLLENFFGIYRNYCSQKKTRKCYIITHILATTIWQTILIIYELYLLLGEVDCNQFNLVFAGFSTSAYLSSVTSIMAGIYYSRAFQSYYRSFSRVSERFKEDKKLNNSLNKGRKFSIGFILYCIVFAIFRSVDTFLKFSHLNPLILTLILVIQTISRIAILFEHLMLFIVVMIVVHLFKCLTSLVSAVQERVGRTDISSDEQCDITREQIQEWVELYQDLVNCCDQVMLCFGSQFFFSIFLSILHYILMAYYIFYKNILNIGNIEEYTRVGIVLFAYVSVIMMPLVAGQLASNQGVKFRRALVRLYNTMIIDSGEAEAKLIKDLIRLINKKPIQIKLLSNITAGMYILPIMLTLTVNYVIVMLQFNHVI